MKNLFNISLMVLIVGTISACSGTRDATAVSTGDTTITSPSASNSVSTGLTAPGKNLNTPDQPTGMASGNSQASLIDTIAADVFLQQAAALGAKKMELGKIAEAKGQSAEVKSFAKSIVEDHAKVTTELQSLAKSKNIELLNNGADIKVDADKLQAISAASFDNSYTAIMIADHDKAVQLFESAAKSSDKEVSAYAKKYLPTLRAHLTKAGDLNKK
ncbi:MAG: DUF4142 domain-containing protein [Pedobacter sp.]|nr:MAG: DUF4142 domain-containing protein [Pedobacter sp.]